MLISLKKGPEFTVSLDFKYNATVHIIRRGDWFGDAP